MRVALLMGSKNKMIIEKLRNLADNVEFFGYPTVQALIKEASLRHIAFDRIIFSTLVLRDIKNDLIELNDFIKSHSESTEVVMLLSPSDTTSDKVFSKIFNSPMYSPAIMRSVTPKSLSEVVQLDMVDLRAKYYVFDVKKETTVGTLVDKQDSMVEEKEFSKGGILSSFISGSRKKPKSSEIVSTPEEEKEEVSEVEEIGLKNSSDFMSGPKSVYTGDMGEFGTGRIGFLEESTENFSSGSGSSTPFGMVNVESENRESEDSEDDGLSIGEFGSAHSDTGYLDEEDEDAELKEFIESKSKKDSAESEVDSQEEVNSELVDELNVMSENDVLGGAEEEDDLFSKLLESPAEILEKPLEDEIEEVEVEYEPINIKGINPVVRKPLVFDTGRCIDLIIGNDSVNLALDVLQEAKEQVKVGARVLVVDLDYRLNGLLSCIDVSRFYSLGKDRGITRKVWYSCDGIDFMSNGYGVGVLMPDVLSLLESREIMGYDSVMFVCPINCLDVLSIDIIGMCNVLIYTGSDVGSLVAISLGLTDRGVVSLPVEKCIMKKCRVDFKSGSPDAKIVKFMKENWLFANGSWLDNIE